MTSFTLTTFQVSWIRRGRHPVVLSSGRLTFTSDKRVRVTQPEGDPDAWQLRVDPVLEKDEALYECQVNTRPDKMSLVFKLNVERKYSYTRCKKIYCFIVSASYIL